MRKITWVVVLVACAALPLLAAEPKADDVVVWSGADLKDYGKKLAPKMDAQKLASERLANFGNHAAMIGHREGDGQAELHETQADVFVVQSGKATLQVGGEVVDGKTTAPGEVRGPSIKGGERKPLAAGDIVHIAAKVPHQLFVEKGQEFTYFVLKIDAPRSDVK